ncbi:MAG: hypothetical protein AB7K68_09635 [Bacteriovoracia bacterium]
MKKFFALALASALLTGLSAYAQEEVKAQDILTALIANSAGLQLEYQDGQKAEQSLPELLGQALALDTRIEKVGQEIVINSVSGHCEATRGALLECRLQINNGDYTATETGYQGPELESSLIFTFTATKNSAGKLKIRGNKVRLDRAG